MIPLVHDFTDETVLVLGGGAVGARKARRFAREATVIVVGPTFPEADYGTDSAGDTEGDSAADSENGTVALIRAAPSPEDVAEWIDRTDPALVVAATDDSAVNEAAETAARERDLLINRADESGGRDAGSVVVPATVRDDPVTVAISTGGRSPALSRALRERVESEIEGAGAMAELTADLRNELKDRGVPAEQRRAALRSVVRSPRVWKGLRTGTDKGRQEAERVIRKERGEQR